MAGFTAAGLDETEKQRLGAVRLGPSKLDERTSLIGWTVIVGTKRRGMVKMSSIA